MRGINVGGKHVLPMAALRRELENLGLQEVRTYIQSGNIVFQSPLRSARKLAASIADSVEQHHGFRVPLILLTQRQLKMAIDQNPYPVASEDAKTLHYFFLQSPPISFDRDKLASMAQPTERFELVGQVFYLHAPAGMARSKLAAAVERTLGVAVTARNARTVQRVAEMVGS